MTNKFPECYEDKRIPEEDFRQLFCARCRNAECVLAEGGENRWVARMATQEERFLKNPQFADPEDPRFKDIRALHFEEALHRAYQMELSDQRGNWEIPETTGPREELQTTDKVDAAVRRLAESQGKAPPTFPEPEPEVEAPPDPPPVKPALSQVPPPRVNPEAPPQQPNPPQRQIPLNTEIPAQGLMVDGSEPVSPSPVPDVVKESWEMPSEQTVAIGGKVVLGPPGGKK